jgi:prepilin-type N-terminal cleavage/methylation domain-containing protein
MSRVRGMTGDDSGLSLIELLVAMVLAVVLMAVTMTTVVNSQKVVVTTKQLQDINEEARQAVNRMARDVRQAQDVVTAVNPDGSTYNAAALTAVRFASDFDGDACIGGTSTINPAAVCLPYNAANPEDITYCFQPGVRQLFVIDNQASAVTPVSSSSTACAGGQPLLAGNVVAFKVQYRSNQYRHDLTPADGITTWREVDAALPPTGNGNGVLDLELRDVDSMVIEVAVELGGRVQKYRTQVDLRNRSR